jgi:hypothetical protein
MSKQITNAPKAPGQIPIENHVFREFGGINTQAARTSIRPEQFSWLENVMPIGAGNLKAVPQKDVALTTLSGKTVYYAKEFNISGVFYQFYACTDGSLYQVRVSDGAQTAIIAGGTFSGSDVQIAQWKNERILIIDSAGGYRDWDGATLTNNSGTTGAPSAGTCIATFSGRVWIVNGTANRTISYSDAASYTAFTGSGGSTTITDEVLTGRIYQLLPANNFLYYFGGDSINVIADVQVVSGDAVFSNTNISANSGTTFSQAIVVYYRAIWYMNQYGIFALYGATPRKASDDLDGIFPRLDFTKPVTAGTVVIFNILCVAFMATYNDPINGARKIIMVYFNKKWYITSQSGSLSLMSTSHNQKDALYGVDGGIIYPMYANTSASISQTIQTALWDFQDYIPIKQSLRVGVEGTLPPTTGNISVTCDTEITSQAPSVPFAQQFSMTWYNNAGAIFSWTNSVGATFIWLISGYIWFQGDVENTGHYLGITVTSNTSANVYNGMQLQYRRLPAGWGN